MANTSEPTPSDTEEWVLVPRDALDVVLDQSNFPMTHYEQHARSALADALACADRVAPDSTAVTDAEWREFQSIPEQGYSHRWWVDKMIADRVSRATEHMVVEWGWHYTTYDKGDVFPQWSKALAEKEVAVSPLHRGLVSRRVTPWRPVETEGEA